MKLKELLFDTFGENVSYPFDQFRKLELEPIKEELLKCDEFSLCDEIEFMEFPVQKIDDNSYTAQTIKVGKDMKFTGKVYIYNISFTPEMYDPNKIYVPVKDGASITPTIYDPFDFTPKKKIVLEYSPEAIMDETNEETKKQEIRDLLDKVLENPQDYQVKGEREVLVRGVFKVNSEKEKPPFLIGDLLEKDHYVAFYMEKTIKDNETTLTMRQKNIPNRLKEEFIKRFTDNGNITTTTTEEIDKFLEENK